MKRLTLELMAAIVFAALFFSHFIIYFWKMAP